MRFEERSERILWHFLTPVFPAVQQLFLRLHLVKHRGRQPFLLGHLASGRTAERLKRFLTQKGFGNHFIAWRDSGQILSLRKRLNFNEQYHIRIFEDGEIRGHFEETPEGHPLKHLLEIGETDRREDFLNFLGDWIIPAEPKNIAADFEKYKAEHA